MADKHEITSMILDEVSLVDDPANPEANVVIAKARQAPPDDDRAGAVRAEIAKAIQDLSPTIIERVGAALPSDTEAADLAAFLLKEKSMDIEELTKALTEAKTALDEATKVTKAKDEEIAKLKTSLEEAVAKAKQADEELAKAKAPKKEETEEDVLKSLPEPLRKRFLALEAADKAKSEEIEKMREERELDEAIAKAKGFAGDPKVVGPALMRIRKGKGTDADVTEIERLLKAQANQEKTSELYKSRGSSAAVDGNPEDLLKAKAEDIAKAKNISFAKAYAEALEANPDLYNAYVEKRRS
ncbi:hypothetical protein KL86PLE_100246 [uncultured Pleomorphomonas sp.]|uniref:Uncharacterized protein n=1 Tax=uncultured Pleomorphomonas sp. TaxID=442121 RepID=A0A212L1T8_9HYPH|nr:hypothetical protein [uncultured Pleomorphomonas sp.]SCM71515.1 hypothetical protein KL86PLE_100246 [uncultured Pleomorphomonas sp.]